MADEPMNPQIEDDEAYIPLAEAAEQLGVSVDTIRRRIRKGLFEARREPTAAGFKWLVRIPDDGQLPPPTAQTPVAPLSDLAIGVFRDQLTVKDEQIKQRDQEIERLTTLLNTQAQSFEGLRAQIEALPEGENPSFWSKVKRILVGH